MKLMVLRVTPEVIVHWIKADFPSNVEFEPELPEDLRVIDITRHYYSDGYQLCNCFDLILESDTFNEVPEGSVIPFLNLIVREKGEKDA